MKQLDDLMRRCRHEGHVLTYQDLVGLQSERDRLSAINAELLEALGRSVNALDRLTDKIQVTEFSNSGEFYIALDEIDLGRAAITKAQGEQQ